MSEVHSAAMQRAPKILQGNTMNKEQVVEVYNNFKKQNGTVPTRNELCKGNNLRRIINKLFGSYSELQRECGDRKHVFVPQVTTCPGCKTDFTTKFEGNIYCSKSCSNKVKKLKHGMYSNYTPLTKQCKECNSTFTRSTSLFCSVTCSMTYEMKNKTIRDIISRKEQNKFDVVRQRARNFSKYFHELKCANCGYDKHYEVCHIKAISSFDLDSSLYEVNHPSNLIHLCPNCHWELDHNELFIEDILQGS